MIGSSQHQLAKYLSTLLQPVLEIYSNNCIKDCFLFAEEIRRLKLKPDESFLCSFDISSLFTNVPLAETIQICADTLYEDDRIVPPTLPKAIFVQLMTAATSCVEFSFNNIMFRQIDGVAMGSPLGPALANIFVGYYENKLFASNSKTFLYQRYVDDIFSIFATETQCDQFFAVLNSLHPSLRFTVEKEKDGVLPFLDVKVEKSSNEFLTSVYRKPTFTGLYTNWNSFEPTKRKTNLVGTLVHRALKICSKSKLQEELNQIRSILQQNDYPEIVINCSIRNKIARFNLEPKEGPQKCPVYLRLPWIGKISLKFETQIKSAVQKCYGAVDPRILFSTRKLLPAIHKDTLPSTHQSMVVYQYVCRCDCRYVGRTSQRLHDRIAQHIPKSIRNKSTVYPQEPCQHATAKQKLHQATTVILRLDFTYYKMMNAPNSTTISNFQF